jgi:hypothetical protein
MAYQSHRMLQGVPISSVVREKSFDLVWVGLYIERWLKAPVQMEDGSVSPFVTHPALQKTWRSSAFSSRRDGIGGSGSRRASVARWSPPARDVACDGDYWADTRPICRPRSCGGSTDIGAPLATRPSYPSAHWRGLATRRSARNGVRSSRPGRRGSSPIRR